MEKFTKLVQKETKIKPETSEFLYKGEYMNVVRYKDYDIVVEPHMVVILPYLKDEGFILLRHEYLPTYQYFYKDSKEFKDVTNFLTVISETVEKGESLQNAVRRGLYEETGIVLSNIYQIDIQNGLFLNKGNVAQYHVCLLEISYNDYKLVAPPTDGSKFEKLSKTIKISLGDLENLKIHDLITGYVIEKFKNEYKLK